MVEIVKPAGTGTSGGANTTFDDLVRPAPAPPTKGGKTFVGTNRNDFAVGTRGNDTLSGRGGNDVLVGLDGNDKLNGGRGNDLILGGRGNDTIRTGTGKDYVAAGSGNDKILVQGSATVDGGTGRDTVTIRGAEGDYTVEKGFRGSRTYVSTGGDRITLRNVETVKFTEPTPPPPPPPPVGKGQPLAPNDAGAERIIVGTDSVRILGPNTDFTFTGLRDQRPVDGPLTATAGSGVINGVETTAVPIGFGDAVFSLGSGFNPTGTQAVQAAFANGVTLDSEIVRPDIPSPIPLPPPLPLPPAGGQPLGPNSVGAERIIVSPGNVRILGPNTDFTFTGIKDGRPADGPLTATAGSGIINGEQTTATALGESNPFDPDAARVVFSLGSGFNPTGTVDVRANFANGEQLNTTIAKT